MTVDYVEYDMILDMAGGRNEYRRFMAEGFRRDLQNPFSDAKFQLILGSESFLRHIRDKYASSGSSREQPAYRKIMKHTVNPESVIDYVAAHFRLSRDNLINLRNKGIARAMVCELLYRYSALTLLEIGEILGIDYSSVYKSRYRLKTQMLKKKRLSDAYRAIENKIKDSLSKV